MEGGDGVLLQVFAGGCQAASDIGVRGEMDDRSASDHGSADGTFIQKFGFNQSETGIGEGLLQKRALTGGEVVESHDRMAALQEAVGDVASDEPGGAGDEDGGRHGRGCSGAW